MTDEQNNNDAKINALQNEIEMGKLREEVKTLRYKIASRTYEAPPEDASEMEKSKYYSKMGVPANADEYSGGSIPKEISHRIRLTSAQEKTISDVHREQQIEATKKIREERLAKIKDKHGDKAYEKATNFYKQIDDDPKFGEEAHMKYIEQQSQPEQQSDYVLSDSRADMGAGSTSLSKYEETKKEANRVHDMSHTHDNYIVEHEFQKLMRNFNGT